MFEIIIALGRIMSIVKWKEGMKIVTVQPSKPQPAAKAAIRCIRSLWLRLMTELLLKFRKWKSAQSVDSHFPYQRK